MTAVSIYYGTVFVMYAQPGAVESMEQGKVVSVFYTLVIPMLNPLIYSLRNEELACADTTTNELVMFGLCGLIIVCTTLVVLISYGYITVTILRMRSGGGRHKLFSTCGSHMTAVSLFYGTLFVMYAQPGAVASMEQGKVVSVFYTLVIPMLNPLIYSLRNKDVKDALWRLGQRHSAT
ncbi:hypothetical protein JEQ12_000050 [Ovis aries]|uniref:G-protein coupled receptors family 1 profile domain-containing protein n=1 Tax=Ovis aries TaxID=9940 RepID=A0A836D7B0_SHEEP|nr:hypothetical protein JEQ12_000050 [Ovis aries]